MILTMRMFGYEWDVDAATLVAANQTSMGVQWTRLHFRLAEGTLVVEKVGTPLESEYWTGVTSSCSNFSKTGCTHRSRSLHEALLNTLFKYKGGIVGTMAVHVFKDYKLSEHCGSLLVYADIGNEITTWIESEEALLRQCGGNP